MLLRNQDANAIASFVESSLQAARRDAKEKLRRSPSAKNDKQHLESSDVQALVAVRSREPKG